MSDKISIQLEEEHFVPKKDITSSELNIKFTGSDCNYKILNTLSRVCTNCVPNHAFPPKLINIEENTCVAFNNDYMRLRLSQLPIYDLDIPTNFLHNKYWKNVNFADLTRPKHPDEKDVKLYLNVHNNSNQIKPVTTNDLKYYLNGELIQPYDEKNPIMLVMLRPNDTFKFSMSAALGVGMLNCIFSACSNSWITYDDELGEDGNRKFKHGNLFLKSRGAFNEYSILVKGCEYLIKKFSDLEADIKERVKTKELEETSSMSLVIDDEDHTLGEILNYELQSHKKIFFSGVSKPDFQIRSIKFKIEGVDEKVNIIECIYDCIHRLQKVFKHIGDEADKLYTKKSNKKGGKSKKE